MSVREMLREREMERRWEMSRERKRERDVERDGGSEIGRDRDREFGLVRVPTLSCVGVPRIGWVTSRAMLMMALANSIIDVVLASAASIRTSHPTDPACA